VKSVDDDAATRVAGLVATALALLGGTLSGLFWPATRPESEVQAAASAILFAAMLLVPGRAWRIVGIATFQLAVTGVLVAGWMTDDELARSGAVFEPFLACKLGAIAIALIAPPQLWVGVSAIAATALLPLIHHAHWPEAMRAGVPQPEPVTAFFYSVTAGVLLAHRRHQLTMQRQLVRAQTQAAAFERYRRKFLAVRDMSNTPLQIIEYTVPVLSAKHPESEREWARLQRAFARLRKLSDVLARYAPRSWSAGDTSFDPLEILEQPDEEETHAEAGGNQRRPDYG